MTALPRPSLITLHRDREASAPTGVRFSPSQSTRTHSGYHRAKRAMDLVLVLPSFLVLLPFMALLALWIKSQDGGPCLYKQWRVGREGELFRIWKFRTMRTDAERQGARFATTGDQRVLRGCQWIRKCHADELPQLFNIIAGHMSLVGPRPERPEVIESLKQELPGFERRLIATPGLTGLAQVVNGYTNDTAGMRRKLALDLRYLRRRGVWMDLGLIVATVRRVWDPMAC